MEMPQPDVEEAGEPQGIPEGAEAPHMEPQAPPVDPMVANTPEDDSFEVEARDKLGLRLVLVADRMAEAARVASAANDAKSAESYAGSAHKLVQAIVLLVPVTAADDLTGNGGSEGTGLASASRSRVDQ